MSQTQNKLVIFAVVLALLALVLSLYSVITLQSLASRITDLSNSVAGLKSDIQALSQQIGKAVPTQPAPQQKVKLVVIGPWSGDEAKYFQAVIEAYQRTHPNVEIEYRTMRAEDVAATMPIQFAAGVAPGDVIFGWGWFIAKMGKEGHLVDLTSIIKQDEYVSGILDAVKADGKVWGAPFTMWLKPGFWYRKSFFQKYGLSEPKSYDEFVQLLEKIKSIQGVKNPIASGDGMGWPLSDIVEHFIIAYGGPQMQLNLISGKTRFTDPSVRRVFENYLVPLLQKKYFSEPIEWTTVIPKWWAGEYGLYFMGTWITGMVEDPNDLDFFPLPESKGVVGGADYAFVPKYSKNVDAAVDFLKFLATEGQGVHASVPSGKIPTWTKVPVSQLWKPMQSVYTKITQRGMAILPDLDDSIGGDWQKLFWDQLKLLWVNPGALDSVLKTLESAQPKP
ncbi:ABC transporter substrate-binding protein [Infirmifilum uzonense]|uniref:ABC transporter substrate-binding protein n=1 Tax=Infirmifilum uzonense TaxID=1550241 RepID=A0A0F7FHF1_9CREN|nr:ABC transporter substrate-binding protein [Infirmifilum uzonense]AKG38240.1 ABC transporter substrate-binding protein [Infirmifilum uzonense]